MPSPPTQSHAVGRTQRRAWSQRVALLGFVFSSTCLLACTRTLPAADALTPQSPERQSDAEYDVARDLFFRGERRAALDHALKAVELNRESPTALYFTSAIYLSFCSDHDALQSTDCRLDEAERYARSAMKEGPEFRDARNLLGQILILENRPAEALEILKPLTRDIGYTQIHLAWGNYGWAQVMLGDLDGGIASLRHAIEEPLFCVGMFRLGIAYERRGRLAEAESSFTRALAVDSPDCKNMQSAWAARGRVRAARGEWANAKSDLERCRDISSTTSEGRNCADVLSDGTLSNQAAKTSDGLRRQ